MGKVGGVQDITTKSTNDMILFEKKSGRVILTSEMAKLVGSHNSINKNINAVYTAVGRLCGDTYIEIQNNDGVSNYAIGPDLVKAIIEGKFDNPTYESINDAIDQYKLYKYDPNASYIYSQEASNNKFCLTGNTPNEWVSNMSKLVNDVKFYYSLVLACSKFGHTNAYDSHLNDNAYVDNEIQNGTFLLMEYNSKNSQLNVSHNTDYYIRSADIWKMSSYSNQAEVQAWYEAERNAIKDKEKFLDTQLQTMNTELSSITTEIESIKSLIEDSIPKSFEWAT